MSIKTTSVMFQDGSVEICYYDEAKMGTQAVIIENIVIKEDLIKDDMDRLRMLLDDMIQAGKLSIRNPPDTFTRPAI